MKNRRGLYNKEVMHEGATDVEVRNKPMRLHLVGALRPTLPKSESEQEIKTIFFSFKELIGGIRRRFVQYGQLEKRQRNKKE